MKYKIDWKNIKNSYKGFEALAVKYVQMEYDLSFTHTKDTRDGNKDAVLEKEIYTIIFGYQSSSNLLKNGGWRQNIVNLKILYRVIV